MCKEIDKKIETLKNEINEIKININNINNNNNINTTNNIQIENNNNLKIINIPFKLENLKIFWKKNLNREISNFSHISPSLKILLFEN